MRAATHIAGGILAAELLMLKKCPDPSETQLTVILGSAIFGSIAPDIDSVDSKISNSGLFAKILGAITEKKEGHRGKLHTPFFCIIVAAILYFALPFLANYLPINIVWGRLAVMAAAAGYLSHLALDLFNPGGIMLYSPFSRKHYHLGMIKTYSLGDWLVCIFLAAAATYLAVRIGIILWQ